MKLAASNVDLREEGAGVTVAFVPVKQHTAIRVHKAYSLSNFSSGFVYFLRFLRQNIQTSLKVKVWLNAAAGNCSSTCSVI